MLLKEQRCAGVLNVAAEIFFLSLARDGSSLLTINNVARAKQGLHSSGKC